MNNRQRFVDYVRHGGAPFCSPQIGAGAGFDSRMAGKEWVSETTMEDTLACVARFEMVPLYNAGLPGAELCDPALGFARVSFAQSTPDKRVSRYELRAPGRTLTMEHVEHIRQGTTPVKFAVEEEDDLDALEWYLERAMEVDVSPIAAHVRALSAAVGERAALSLQWGAQPYELLSWPSTVTTMLMANDIPERFYRLMDKILAWDMRLLDCCQAGGADFVFLGGPAAEMISPKYYENFLVPYSKIFTDEAHKRGLLVYSHICSPIEPMLSMGYYNQMGIDLFETLSMKPVGNVLSLADALTKLDPRICTRGNIGLDVLLTQNAQTVREHCRTALREAAGRKHILAASDYLFYDIPEENVRAMCEAVAETRESKTRN